MRKIYALNQGDKYSEQEAKGDGQTRLRQFHFPQKLMLKALVSNFTLFLKQKIYLKII